MVCLQESGLTQLLADYCVGIKGPHMYIVTALGLYVKWYFVLIMSSVPQVIPHLIDITLREPSCAQMY